MHRARFLGTALTCAVLVEAAMARAETTADLSASVGETPPPTTEVLPLLQDKTAYLVGARRLKLGLLAFEYGLTDKVSIGTDPPAWAARAVVSILIPNLHVHVQFFHRGPVTLTLLGAGYYGILKENGSASGSMVAVPVSMFGSFRLHERVWLHEELTYLFVHAFGTGDFHDAGFDGRVAGQALQTGTVLEVRLTRIFSLTATGRVELWTGRLAFDASSNTDPYTSINIDGTAMPRVEHPWNVVGGVAFLWKHFHLVAGAGYGYYFLPGLDVPSPHLGFVPDVSLAVIL